MVSRIKNLLRFLYYLRSYLKFKTKGKNLWISKGGVFIRPEEISFGDNIFIARNFHISARNLVFKNNIMIGPNLVIECDNHVYDEIGKTMFENRNKRNISGVTIENDVWIGANVTILSGAVIGEGTIVGAGSVVTKSLPKYSICVGNPCKVIKKRFNDDELIHHLEKVAEK